MLKMKLIVILLVGTLVLQEVKANGIVIQVEQHVNGCNGGCGGGCDETAEEPIICDPPCDDPEVCEAINGVPQCVCPEDNYLIGGNCTEGPIICDPPCGDPEVCEAIDGVPQCVCPEDNYLIGGNCTETCELPGQVVEDFGCLYPIAELLTYDEARERCQDMRGDHIRKIKTNAQIVAIEAAMSPALPFTPFLAWVGLVDSVWLDNTTISTSSPLWDPSESTYTRCTKFRGILICTTSCNHPAYAVCQLD